MPTVWVCALLALALAGCAGGDAGEKGTDGMPGNGADGGDPVLDGCGDGLLHSAPYGPDDLASWTDVQDGGGLTEAELDALFRFAAPSLRTFNGTAYADVWAMVELHGSHWFYNVTGRHDGADVDAYRWVFPDADRRAIELIDWRLGAVPAEVLAWAARLVEDWNRTSGIIDDGRTVTGAVWAFSNGCLHLFYAPAATSAPTQTYSGGGFTAHVRVADGHVVGAYREE